MDTFALHSPSSLVSGAAGDDDRPAPRREQLAIVSTSDALCGIAAYTAALRGQLSDDFDITVFDLDQYLLRSRQRELAAKGDRHIKLLCRELPRFDTVNLQLEFGTLGRAATDIFRRLRWLVAASPRLSITFHTLLPPPRFPVGDFVKATAMLDWRRSMRIHAEFRRHHLLSLRLARLLRRARRSKQISAIVHTRRDCSEIRHLYGLDHVFDHPLAFLSAETAGAIRGRASRRNFPMLDGLPDDTKLIGVFGFINGYKGLGTAVRALRHLPENHHLLIFGGVHPKEIAVRQAIYPYLSELFADGFIDATPYAQIAERPALAGQLVINTDQGLGELIGPHPGDLSARIHFMGAPEDRDFLSGMASCDVVVFPYMEVGQSASGPISQALELGCRIIASRTHTFLNFAQYHRDAIEFFDIGNHLELAQRILARRQFTPRAGPPAYNTETNRMVYRAANGKLPPQPRDGFSAAAGSRVRERAVRAR